jgi:hypothetical protein
LTAARSTYRRFCAALRKLDAFAPPLRREVRAQPLVWRTEVPFASNVNFGRLLPSVSSRRLECRHDCPSG